MSDSGLIVPIDVTATVIGKPDASAVNGFAAVASNFALMPTTRRWAPTAQNLLPKPFDAVDSRDAMQPGIHLHWALPDSLARGRTDGGKVAFLQAPNLWLVTRFAGGNADGSTVQTARVIESDQLQQVQDQTLPQNIYSRAVPVTPDLTGASQPFLFQAGLPPADWAGRNGGTYASSNTTVGYGTPAYAAAYPNCPNVFSFWDPLDDDDAKAFTAETLLSYSVVGWYANSASDPLATTGLSGQRHHRGGAPGLYRPDPEWALSGSPDVPNRTVCNGLLSGLTWDPQRAG